MGFLSSSAFAATLLVLSLLGVVFVGWVLKFVYKAAVALNRTLESSDDQIVKVLCPCIFKGHYSAFQLTLRFTVVAVTCFFLAHISCALRCVSLLALCRNCTVALVFNYSNVFVMGVGYTLMFAVQFERLRLCFSGTVLQLPQWAPNVLYAALSFSWAMIPLANAFRDINSHVSAACTFLFVAMYFMGLCALSHAFFKKTMKIAGRTANDRSNDDLKQTAVRMTLAVTLSAVSSAFAGLTWVVIFAICPNCLFWRLIGNIFLSFDNSFNAFCLMCTFAPAVDYYLCVFGRLHNCFLGHVLKTERQKQREAVGSNMALSKTTSASSKSEQSI